MTRKCIIAARQLRILNPSLYSLGKLLNRVIEALSEADPTEHDRLDIGGLCVKEIDT